MAGPSEIQWTQFTWNPIVGCSIVSPGCTNCYAMKMAARIETMGTVSHYVGTTKKVNGNAVWTGKLALAPEKILTEPLRRRKPTTWFVNSMGDLFHEDVPDEWIDRVFAVMALCPQHRFQILTKRPKRMKAWFLERWQGTPEQHLTVGGEPYDIPAGGETGRRLQIEEACEPFLEMLGLVDTDNDDLWTEDGQSKAMQWAWPLPNVWLGVSAERQKEADERIPLLLETPAAIRFVSCEPLLGPIDLLPWLSSEIAAVETIASCIKSGAVEEMEGAREQGRLEFARKTAAVDAKLDWVIVGGESGPKARPMHPDWARSLREQCTAAGVPFFFKQWGAWLVADPVENDKRFGDGYTYWRFGDGEEWHVISDGHDIVLGAAETAKAPKQIWDKYWGDGHGHLAKRPGKAAAGRLLDGREWNEMPSSSKQSDLT